MYDFRAMGKELVEPKVHHLITFSLYAPVFISATVTWFARLVVQKISHLKEGKWDMTSCFTYVILYAEI